MSPTAFKQQLTQLASELKRCLELCDEIRVNRHLPRTTETLDRLQSGIKHTINTIDIEFNAIRRFIGSRMDLGDEAARISLQRAIRDVQTDIHVKLSDIAYKRRDIQEREAPGFRDIHKRLQGVEAHVFMTLESLSRRLEASKAVPEAPKPSIPKPRTDEAVVKLKELDRMLEHMKNSWVEKVVAGRILYVNVFDDKKSTFDRPNGFIKELPRAARPAKVPSWDREAPLPRRPMRHESWGNGRGW